MTARILTLLRHAGAGEWACAVGLAAFVPVLLAIWSVIDPVSTNLN